VCVCVAQQELTDMKRRSASKKEAGGENTQKKQQKERTKVHVAETRLSHHIPLSSTLVHTRKGEIRRDAPKTPGKYFFAESLPSFSFLFALFTVLVLSACYGHTRR
jgi:hypothetical protein